MNEINFNIENVGTIDLSMDVGIKEIYPPIENLEVTPTKDQQVFTHENSYGYDKVTVKAIPKELMVEDLTEELNTYNTELTEQEITINDIVEALKDKASGGSVKLQDKEVTPTKEIQNITSDENYDGLNQVTVNAIPDEYIVPSGSLDITENGVTDVTRYAEVNVNIASGGADFEINDCSYLFYNGAKINIMNELLALCKNVTDTNYMFSECRSLTELDLSNFDTSNVTNFNNMFQGCTSLTSLNISNVTTMYEMFSGCSKLKSLDLSNFNTIQATNMEKMFYSCSELTSLDLSNFNTSKVTNMKGVFNGCNALTSLDLSVFDTSKVTNMSSMFSWCSALKNLDIRNFTFDKVTSYSNMFNNVPTDCLIIVKSDTEKEWITSKFTTLTNVKTVAEYEG